MSDSEPDKDEEPGFRVVDRRRFDAEGEERSTTSSEEGSVAAGGASAGAPTEVPGAAPAESPEAPPPQFGEAQGAPRDVPPAGEAVAPTFSSLVLSLSTQALLCLGEIAETADADPHIDLAAGRQLIDLLAILQQKTQGNLDASEAELLERILYDLRLRFVEISRQQAPTAHT
jgi:hypothetical protein